MKVIEKVLSWLWRTFYLFFQGSNLISCTEGKRAEGSREYKASAWGFLFLIFCFCFKDNWQSCLRSTTSEKRSAWLLQIGDLRHWPANTVSNWNQRITLAFPHWQEMETDGLSLVYVCCCCCCLNEKSSMWHFLKKKGNSFVRVLFVTHGLSGKWCSCTSETV